MIKKFLMRKSGLFILRWPIALIHIGPCIGWTQLIANATNEQHKRPSDLTDNFGIFHFFK